MKIAGHGCPSESIDLNDLKDAFSGQTGIGSGLVTDVAEKYAEKY
jgi:hypothetical protein